LTSTRRNQSAFLKLQVAVDGTARRSGYRIFQQRSAPAALALMSAPRSCPIDLRIEEESQTASGQ
jgi:hypothetical protein